MPGDITLSVTEGPLAGHTFTFGSTTRSSSVVPADCHAHLSPDDTSASRHHFILEVNPPDARLRDLGSLNGTYVNRVRWGGRHPHETPEEGARRRFPDVELNDGDQIAVGRTVIAVSIQVPALCLNCGAVLAAGGRDGNQPALCPQCQANQGRDRRRGTDTAVSTMP